MVLTVSFVLSPVTGLFCHRRLANNAKLDASVGGVRTTRLRRPHQHDSSSAHPRPSHPVPNVRDDRDTPLCVGRDGGGSKVDLPDMLSGIFFAQGLDSQKLICPSGQNWTCSMRPLLNTAQEASAFSGGSRVPADLHHPQIIGRAGLAERNAGNYHD